jgi:hypothetical protein
VDVNTLIHTQARSPMHTHTPPPPATQPVTDCVVGRCGSVSPCPNMYHMCLPGRSSHPSRNGGCEEGLAILRREGIN